MPRKTSQYFSDEESFLLKAFYPMTNTNFLAKTLLKNYTRAQIFAKAHHLGISKSDGYEIERKTIYKPGNIPLNKGMGTSPRLIKERLRKRFRLKDGKIRTIGQVVWHKHHGYYPPDNYCITYKDGNVQNNAIENLEMISRSELAIRNHKKIPNFLRSLILIRARLVRSLNEHDEHNK